MSDAGTGNAHGQVAGDEQSVPPAYATRVLLALIWLLFAGEVLVPAGAWQGLSEPSISTLVAWGGMSGTMVLERGEWFRIFTAALLHGGYVHLLFNSYALYSAGRMLEPLVGWPWFVALYVEYHRSAAGWPRLPSMRRTSWGSALLVPSWGCLASS